MLKKLLLSLALGSSLFAMHDASLNLNNEDIEAKANIDLGELNQSDYPDIYFLTLGFLKADNKEDASSLLEAGFMLRQDVNGVDGLRMAVGIKGTYTKLGSLKHAAAPLGAELAYTLPIDVMPVVLSGTFYYAPSVLTFKDADKYKEARVELGLNLMDHGTLFVGYRYIDTDYDAVNYTYNDSGYIGFRVKF